MRVVITGAGGNLGGKLIAHLQSAQWCSAIVGIDPKPLPDSGKVRAVGADLRDPHDRRWIDPVQQADAVVHFAAQNPAPDSNWVEATQSIDMTMNLLQWSGQTPCRFVFASSNHVMGGYKDAPLPPGQQLTGDTPPRPGTRYFDGYDYRTPTAYGASKLMGERAVAARCAASLLTGVNVRIGWVQAGENRPQTIDLRGAGQRIGPTLPDQEEIERGMTWFRGMWLSNRDFVQLMEKAITTPADQWPSRAIVVNGMSHNTGTVWNLDEGRRLLGYAPVDDISVG
ncbi:MAG TPA: NAD(P)-dependent oxidoreductase [Devosia sp.]|nr:NAD(P)-dependent oxidoreductase [Devosia sp.]